MYTKNGLQEYIKIKLSNKNNMLLLLLCLYYNHHTAAVSALYTCCSGIRNNINIIMVGGKTTIYTHIQIHIILIYPLPNKLLLCRLEFIFYTSAKIDFITDLRRAE